MARKKLSIPITANDIVGFMARHGVSTCKLPNGAVHITGSRTALEKVRDEIWKKHKIDARLVLEHKVDGVAQSGFPRIELHPQVMQKYNPTTSTYWSIDTGDGTQLTTGLSPEVYARRVAQRFADERGDSVWLYSSDDDEGEAEEVSPKTRRNPKTKNPPTLDPKKVARLLNPWS